MAKLDKFCLHFASTLYETWRFIYFIRCGMNRFFLLAGQLKDASLGQPDTKPAALVAEVADFEDEALQLDSETLSAEAAGALHAGGAASAGTPSGIVRARRYDVSITYDKYYQTPRWLRTLLTVSSFICFIILILFCILNPLESIGFGCLDTMKAAIP